MCVVIIFLKCIQHTIHLCSNFCELRFMAMKRWHGWRKVKNPKKKTKNKDGQRLHCQHTSILADCAALWSPGLKCVASRITIDEKLQYNRGCNVPEASNLSWSFFLRRLLRHTQCLLHPPLALPNRFYTIVLNTNRDLYGDYFKNL